MRKTHLIIIGVIFIICMLGCINIKQVNYQELAEQPKQETFYINNSDNVTIKMYRISFRGITLETPAFTRCEWNISKPMRTCRQEVKIIYDKFSAFSLSEDYFSYKFKSDRMKNIRVKFPSVLKRGSNTIIYEFEYPPNAGEEWGLSFKFGGNEWEIDPTISGCSDITSPGTYTLNQSILDSSTSRCINISANNVVLDCQGHTIDGNDLADYGIYILRSSEQTTNITVKNCVVTDWDSANIYLKYANGNAITNVTANSSPDNGFYLYYSDSNTISNSAANSNNQNGFYFLSSDSNSISNCTANSNNYGFYFSSSNSNTISKFTANLNNYGFYLSSARSNTISNSTVQESYYYDFYIYGTDSDCNNKIENLTGSNNLPIKYFNSSVTLQNEVLSELILCNADYSNIENITINASQSKKNNMVLLLRTDYSNLTGISSSDNYYGFYIRYSDSNTLSNCTTNSNAFYGFYLYYSDLNTISGSTAENNVNGIVLSYAESNKIYNNFFNNSDNFYFGGTIYTNHWNTTKQLGTRIYSNGNYIGGNYYTNPSGNGYSDTCNDTDHDGFCDDQYNLTSDGKNIDYLPYSDEYIGEPYVLYVNLTPDYPNENDNLYLNVTCVWRDSEDNVTAYWKFYKNGAEQQNLGGSKEVEHNVNTLLTTIGSGNTSINENWTAEVWCGNGTYNSSVKSDSVILEDGTPPSYSDNSTNTTTAGESTEFRVKWTDNYNLTGGGFIFSWHNGMNWTKTSNSGDLESGEQSFKELKATYTFFDNFDDGDLGSNWTTYKSDATYGRIGVRTDDAHSGSYSVIADVNSNGHYNLNELITNYDFSGATEVILTFWHREWNDEETSGADHTDHYNSDAYYFTCDGTNWKHLGDLGNPGSTWTKVTVNITADPDWCGTADSNFKIKFTQYDDYALTSDGRGFDDINITYTAPGGQEANRTPITYSDINLDTYESLDNITVTVYVSYYNNSGSQANGNTNPTLWLEVYNGTDWVDEGSFSVTGTGNFSITVTTPSVLQSWKTEANRDIRISARYMDYNDSTHYDQINWTGVWVDVFSEQEFLNDSFREFNSSICLNDTVCWSNVTKTVTSQVGATIKWMVYARDLVGNWNQTPIYSYVTTSEEVTTTTLPNIMSIFETYLRRRG